VLQQASFFSFRSVLQQASEMPVLLAMSHTTPRVAVVVSEELRKDGQSMQQLVFFFSFFGLSPTAPTACGIQNHANEKCLKIFQMLSCRSAPLCPFS
jgi:hypothetical protein